ncbi:MAG: hypothetical protein AAB701_00140 [Patescibacteria group bacterium]
MIVEGLALAAAVFGVYIWADHKVGRKEAMTGLRQYPKNDLHKVRIGVACFQSNGSAHEIEGEIMNRILEGNGCCIVTNRKRAQELFKGLDVADAPSPIAEADLLVIGMMVTETSVGSSINDRLKLDFRCYNQRGEIFGAGNLVRCVYKQALAQETQQALRSMAEELVSRLHIDSDSKRIWYGEAKEAAISVNTQLSLPEGGGLVQ